MMKENVSKATGISEIFPNLVEPVIHFTAIATVFFLLLALFDVPAAQAQTGGHISGPRPAVNAQPSAVHVAARAGVAQQTSSTPTATTMTSAARHPRVVVLSPNSTFNFDDASGAFPTPGLGFDFAHLAAVNSGAGVRALIDPVTQHELALARAIRRETPFGFAAFPGFFPSFQQGGSEPMIIVIPQAAAAAEQIPERSRAQEFEPPQAPAPPVEPARDAGDFVLVRRDGGLLFAVAFTQGAERITYVTKEGIRRSVTFTDLDVDATGRMNEERGTPLRFLEALRQ